MTQDHAIALSLVPDLTRVGLTERLQHDDPELIDIADRYLVSSREARGLAIQEDVHAIAWNAPQFPPLLLATPDCPPALWYRGRLDALAAPAVAIVGSRAATAVALEVAATLASDLAAAGVVVVSGLARGVDSAAHRGALKWGKTIAVLGSALDHLYPAEHEPLAREIARQGLVLSEYPPGTPPLPFHFPQRNRLISGLARAVVVIEAAEKSGSLITAACALEQGRDVMVVPGNVLTGRNRGGHALIRDGAKIVESADDIVAELGLASALSPAAGAGPGKIPGDRDPVLGVMTEGEIYDLDQLTAALGLPGPPVLARLLELELQGWVRRVGGGRFMRPGRTC